MTRGTVLLLLTVFLLLGQQSNGQTDTINKTDSAGLKQGHWIIKNNVKKLPNYSPDAIVEEGKYVDNKKDGVWKMYYPNGKIKSEITFRKMKVDGFAKMYYENGCIQEEGLWQNNRWIGNYKQYRGDTCGKVLYDFDYGTTGKRQGSTQWPPDGQIMMKWDMKEGWIEYYENGDTAKIIKKTFQDKSDTTKPSPPFNGTGYAVLKNLSGQISKDGTFKNYKLIDGKDYIYNKDGNLTQIAVYKNGQYIGDAPIEEKDK